jgi:multiple sugar transport system substrate-binding protein
MKRIVVLVLFLVLAASFVSAQGLKNVKLTVWGCFTELQAPLNKAVEIFQKENPGSQVEVLVFDLRDFEAKVAATAPMGQAADLIVMDHSLTARYARAGILANAPADVETWVNTPGRYIKAAQEKAKYQGKVVGMPFFGGGPVLYYNKDYFAKAGIAKPPATVDELYKDAVKLRVSDASGKLVRSGMSLRLTGPTGGTQKWAWISNQLLGADCVVAGKAPGTYHGNLDNVESAKALQWTVKLLHGQDKSDDWALKHDAEGFAAGETAMFFRESYVIPYMKEHAPSINYGVALMPRDKYWRIYDWSVNSCVPKSGSQQQAAWEFAKVMQKEEVMEILFKDSGWIPSRRDLSFSSVLSEEPRFKTFMTLPPGAEIYFENDASSYTEMWTKVGEVLQAAFRDPSLAGDLNKCRAVVKNANDTANQILKDNGEYGE